MGSSRFPFGHPSGWFVVATSEEVKPGKIISRRYFDREIVIYRTETGEVNVIDAFCPHMGAHLGKMGTLDKGIMRCGFHGFQYDGAGSCVATEYDSPPPRAARLTRWDVREQSQVIMVWFDPDGRPADWEIPLFEDLSWSRARWKKYRIRTHPQETTENSVDFGHFTKLHGFVDGHITEPLRTEGPVLTSSYRAMRPYGLPGKTLVKIPVCYDVTAAGLGYSQVEVQINTFGLNLLVWVLSIPVDDEYIDLRLGLAVEKKFGPLVPLVRRIGHGILSGEVNQDLNVWEHKSYVDPPAVAKGDGPIVAYRRWTKQFYAKDSSSEIPEMED